MVILLLVLSLLHWLTDFDPSTHNAVMLPHASDGLGLMPCRTAPSLKVRGSRGLRVQRHDWETEHTERHDLLRDTSQEFFKFNNVEVQLLVPSYTLDPKRLEDAEELDISSFADFVWPAELALTHVLLQRRQLWESAGVCELGAGLGLAGIAVAAAGASRVLITDCDAMTLELASRSAVLNAVDDVVSVSSVDWTDPKSWPSGDQGLVVAADVLYNARFLTPLADLILHLGGHAVIMEPTTSERLLLKQVTDFKKALLSRGLSLDIEFYEDAAHGIPPMHVLIASRVPQAM